MKGERFVFRSRIPASAKSIFDWHTRTRAFERPHATNGSLADPRTYRGNRK